MVKFSVNNECDNQRLDKYLSSLMPGASFSFIQKIIRKKYINVNDKKVSSNIRIKSGDEIKIFLSEDTYISFLSDEKKEKSYNAVKNLKFSDPDIVYEDKDVIIANKPFGVLSQKAKGDDASINDVLLSYCINNGYSFDEFLRYRPSIANRLDRNTGGLIIFTKTKFAAIMFSEDIKKRKVIREYNAVLLGNATLSGEYEAYYKKDSKENRANIFDKKTDDSEKIITIFNTINMNENFTLVKASLKTGKSHQIRAMAKFLGHPIFNDPKYNDEKQFQLSVKPKLRGQYLIANRVFYPDKNIDVSIDLPDEFKEVI